MKQVRFCGKACVIGKCAQRIDGSVDEDAGEQAAAAIEDRDQQDAHRDGKDDLAQAADQIHAAAVEQVDEAITNRLASSIQQEKMYLPFTMSLFAIGSSAEKTKSLASLAF